MPELVCPMCGNARLDLCRYRSMMVLSPDVALFKVQCPVCKTDLSALQPIPPQLREQVRFAAHEVGAGMGDAPKA